MAQKINYCPSCGERLNADYILCPHCGEDLRELTEKAEGERPEETVSPQNHPDFKPPERTFMLWGLLGFLVPLVGVILYLVWREEQPRIANAVGAGALASIVITLLFIMFIATAAGAQGTIMH